MGKSQAIYKVPGGKLLKVFLDVHDGKIADIKITGDFFMYPEEKINMLEDAMRGQGLDENSLVENLDKVIEDEKLELFGLDSAGIVTTIMMAANAS